MTNTAAAAMLAPEFDAAFYRSRHRDLAGFSDDALRSHYERYGRLEGRQASPLADTAALIEALRRLSPALEIGPFDRPQLSGPGVHYLDVIDTAALKARADLLGRIAEAVPEIDYVVPEGDLSAIAERFALVFSSHAIEHQPDLVRHLQQVEALLAPNGVYALVIPDCRYCFDHFIAPSTVASALQAHEEQRTRHTLASVVEHRALTTHNDAKLHWQGDHGNPHADPDRVRAAMEEWASQAGYLDVHAWQFTPASFREVISVLCALGLTGLSVLRIYDTRHGTFEFGAILSANSVSQA